MALRYGSDVKDVTADEDALESLLKGSETPAPTWDGIQAAALGEDPYRDYEKPGIEEVVFPDDPKPLPKKVAAATRKDIRGKVAMLLTGAALPLRQRDPVCVGALIEAIPDQTDEDGDTQVGIASALTDLICDSPDMVKWFTASGKYMKWFTLMMTVQPVLTVAFHHHVTHAIGDEDTVADTPDWSQYGV